MTTFNGYLISPEFLKEMNQPTLNSMISNTIQQEDEEEKLLVWEPSDDTQDSINSLEVFRTLYSDEDSRKLTTKEIKLSLKNFDNWLINSIESLIEEEKEKDINMFK